MVLFGWICLLFITLYVTVCSVGIAVLCSATVGRISEGWIGIIISGLLWWGVVEWAPFSVVTN